MQPKQDCIEDSGQLRQLCLACIDRLICPEDMPYRQMTPLPDVSRDAMQAALFDSGWKRLLTKDFVYVPK